MNSVPVHPFLVHLPLALAVLIPAAAGGLAWAILSHRVRPRVWSVIVALQALLVFSGWLAMQTGSRDEERVENVVSKGALHQHEELAEQFVWASAATAGLAILALVIRRPLVARAVTLSTVVATFVVAGLAIRVGHAGGQLVYVHGAASAYTASGPARGDQPTRPPTEPRDDDRHP